MEQALDPSPALHQHMITSFNSCPGEEFRYSTTAPSTGIETPAPNQVTINGRVAASAALVSVP
jgi:hypothetical protein